MTTTSSETALDVSAPDVGEPREAHDLVAPLGDTGWTLWRWAALRGAGLPADRLFRLCDEDLAAAADLVEDDSAETGERYSEEFAAAVSRLGVSLRTVVADEAFREAVTWQNPGLAHDCLDQIARGERRNARGRYHELTVASYLQRYSVKNDTVGFFGPVGWAWLGTSDDGVVAAPGTELLVERTTHFEHWAVTALADVLAGRSEVFPWLRPRPELSASVEGAVARLPLRRPVRLSMNELATLRRCDGRRTIRDIAGDPPDPAVVAALLRLREVGVLRLDLRGPLSSWPERDLADLLTAVGDPAVRARAEAPLSELVSARDDLAAAAGDARAVAVATEALASTFTRLTAGPAERMAGATYVGRTIAYEDTRRGIDVRVGQAALDRLAAPLGLILESAAWLADALAQGLTAAASERLAATTDSRDGAAVPLEDLLMTFMPEMSADKGTPESAILRTVVAELQDRWRRIVGATDGPATGHLRFSAAELAGGVAREFATDRPGCPDASWHSPDIMITARDRAALETGDVDYVLGELHCATNTLRSILFTENHPDRTHQRRLIEALDRGNRFVTVARTHWPMITSRMLWAPEVMLPSYTYLCLGDEAMSPPAGATTLSVVDLEVVATDTGPTVRHRRTGRVHAFADVVGDLVQRLALDAFRPFPAGRSRPRISIDRLVVARAETTTPATELGWAHEPDEARRFARARRWRSTAGLPERVFVRVPVERKPIALDFRSLPLVNLVAKAIRRSADVPDATVSVAEMLPDLDALWLTDGDGQRYTAELRLLALRPGLVRA